MKHKINKLLLCSIIMHHVRPNSSCVKQQLKEKLCSHRMVAMWVVSANERCSASLPAESMPYDTNTLSYVSTYAMNHHLNECSNS